MSLLTSDHALELCEGLLQKSGADETEVTLTSEEDRFVRYGPSGPTQSADRECHEVRIRARLGSNEGWREGLATSGSLDEGSLTAALQRAETLARHGAPDPLRLPLGGAAEVPPGALFRPTQDHSFREKGAWVQAALDASAREGLQAAGLARTTVQQRHLLNSAGRQVEGARSRASFSLVASPRDGSGDGGIDEQIAMDVTRLDPVGVVARAIERGARGRNPSELFAGPRTVVLEPAAVAGMLLFLSYEGLGAKELHEGRSALVGRIGERLFPEDLCLLDDSGHELHSSWRFDGEGTPRQTVALVRDGALKGPVTDARWARQLGLPDTGHGAPQPSADGPRPENLVILPGLTSREELIGAVDDGVLVSRVHYTNLIEPRDMVLTGMTRGGTFRIRGGQVAEPVKNLRFTMSLIQALASVRGIGNELAVSGALFRGEVLCPALLIEGFQFTSTTEL